MIQLTRPQKYLLGAALLVLLLLLLAKSPARPITSVSPQPGYPEFASSYDAGIEPITFSEKSLAPSERVGGIADALEGAVPDGSSEQRVIKQAELDLLVDAVEETQVKLAEVAKTYGGFVRDASVYERNDKTLYGQAVLRVEVARFDAALADIRALSLNVERERVTGLDVTEEFTDLEAQLRNARAEESAYLALLNRAGSVTELLEVQRELSNVRGRIEMLEGRMTYLENQTDLATITVSLSEKPSLIAPTGDFRIGDTIKEAAQALVVAFQEVARAIIWIVIVGVGIGLPPALILWIAYRIWKKHHHS